jgi:hypothetical protein
LPKWLQTGWHVTILVVRKNRQSLLLLMRKCG